MAHMAPEKLDKVFESLTDKQIEALSLAAQHLTSKQIAQELGVSPATIDKRIEGIRARLDQMPRPDLLRHFIQWRQRSGHVIADYFPLPTAVKNGAAPVQQSPELRYELEDSIPFDMRMSWDRASDGLLPRVDLENLGKLGRTGAMFMGSIVLVIGFILVVTSAQAVENLLGL